MKFITKYRDYLILLAIAIIIRQLIIYKYSVNTNKQVTELFLNSKNKTNTIYVERVTTPETIAKGLMFRKEPLAQNQGMLFDKGTWSSSGFWMKNTYIPLDILFLDEDFTVIDILYNMKPLDATSRNINKPWRYAIEINAGDMRHIIPGSHVNVIDSA
jgi:uncharacterized membrane protein (UPF0127 family)